MTKIISEGRRIELRKAEWQTNLVFPMKVLAIFAPLIVQSLSASTEDPTWQELSSRLFTNGPIVWQAPINHLPKQFWVYHRHLPRIFPATVITNAIVLASLQDRGFPSPSTNFTFINVDPGWGGRPPGFTIDPNEATISFSSSDYQNASSNGIPSDEVIARRAWLCVPQLGLDPTQMIQKSLFTHKNQGSKTNFICGRGIFLSRQLDGVPFFSDDDTGSGDCEGFTIEFGSDGQVRNFTFCWSELEHYKSEQIASLQELTQCIKAHKTIVLQKNGETDYFSRLKALANAKKLTIMKITPYYEPGALGDSPTNIVPSKFVTPIAVLDAVADFGTSNATLRLVSPILSSDVKKVLESKWPE